jgi:outer membrane protein
MLQKWTVTIAALAILLGSSPALRAQEPMTLEQFIDTAVKNSPAVQIAGESVAGAEFRIREAKSQALPQINLGSSYTRISLLSEFDIPGMGHFKFGTPNNLNFRVGASEQVFTWGRIKNTVQMSQIGMDLAQGGVALTKQTLAYQLVPIFYGVLFTREAVKVLDQTIDLLEKKLATLEERYRAGLASDFDISLIKVQLSGLQSQKLDFENNIRKIMMAYNRIAARPLESTFTPAGEFAFEPVVADAKALAEEAAANRIESKLLGNQRNLAQTQIALARSANKPNVAAGFNYEFRNGFLPSVDQIRGNWSAAVSVSYPVFDGHRTSAQVAQAQVGLRAVEEQATDQLLGFELEIDQTLADLKTLEQKIEIEKTKIAHAERALKIADERYQNGLLSTTDLVEAQDLVDSARLNYLQLVYNHVLGKFNLFKAAGRKIYS